MIILLAILFITILTIVLSIRNFKKQHEEDTLRFMCIEHQMNGDRFHEKVKEGLLAIGIDTKQCPICFEDFDDR